MAEHKLPVSIRLQDYRRMSKVELEFYDALVELEKKYELTIFELIWLLVKFATSFSASGREIELEELHDKIGKEE